MRYLSLLLIFICSQSIAANQVVTYGPSIVHFVGTLDLQTFPGPPNYESVKDGDDIERHFYLKLDKPIDVLPSSKNVDIQDAEIERNVRIVQLSIGEDEKLWAKFRAAGKGAHVTIAGTLFHRFTGHHHSRVLMMVDNMKGD